MSSSLRSLIQRIYPSFGGSGGPSRVLIAGMDYSGKTTLLYLLKTGEIVPTIATIGFNVETVSVPTGPKNTPLDLELWDIGSGCGGPFLLLRLLRFYLPGAKGLIWVVDSADQERLVENFEAFKLLLDQIDEEPELQGKHFPILVLATKTDLEGSKPIDYLRLAFSQYLRGRLFSVHPVCLTSKPPQGIKDAFDWLALALDIAKTTPRASAVPDAATLAPPRAPVEPEKSVEKAVGTPNARDPSLLAKKMEEWLHRTATDSAPEEFIAQFEAYNLPAWDHYTHIRLAFLILVAHGRQKGKDILFKGLADYIAHAPNSQTNARAFHFTMTYFWIQLVHFGIRNMPPNTLSVSPPSSTAEASDSLLYPSSEDFFRFLLINPHLVDGGIWGTFYSKETLMSPEAKAHMVLPDKKPLPSVVGRDAIAQFGEAKA